MDTADIEAAFSEHEGVQDIRLVDSVEDEYLLRVEWEPEYAGIMTALTEAEVTLVTTVGTREQWMFDVRGENREDVARFLRLCRERDIPVTLTTLNALTPAKRVAEAALTDPQREVLELAYERGFFESPRGVTMGDLGAELGISQQAVSSRLRRGTRVIVGQTLSAPNDRARVT